MVNKHNYYYYIYRELETLRTEKKIHSKSDKGIQPHFFVFVKYRQKEHYSLITVRVMVFFY